MVAVDLVILTPGSAQRCDSVERLADRQTKPAEISGQGVAPTQTGSADLSNRRKRCPLPPRALDTC